MLKTYRSLAEKIKYKSEEIIQRRKKVEKICSEFFKLKEKFDEVLVSKNYFQKVSAYKAFRAGLIFFYKKHTELFENKIENEIGEEVIFTGVNPFSTLLTTEDINFLEEIDSTQPFYGNGNKIHFKNDPTESFGEEEQAIREARFRREMHMAVPDGDLIMKLIPTVNHEGWNTIINSFEKSRERFNACADECESKVNLYAFYKAYGIVFTDEDITRFDDKSTLHDFYKAYGR